MTSTLARFLPLTLLLGLAACGPAPTPKPGDRCKGVSCEPSLSCDPGDGICKCGGQGGTICDKGGVCDENRQACVYPACASVRCTGGSTCDPLDGKCKCGGQGGLACSPSEICDSASRTCVAAAKCTAVVCGSGTACDPVDGVCKCGAAVCGAFEICKANACVANPCNGVNCTGGTSCSPADGKCHCGPADGDICTFGQTCDCPAGGTCASTDKKCLGSALCQNVTCAGGTTCDPADGRCKCGGPGGPICGAGQSCDVLAKACLGGDRCAGITCTGGLTCDPEDGQCKCGGLNGQICRPNQTCAPFADKSRCVTPCDPRRQGCDVGLGCYYDIIAKTAYCTAAGVKSEGAGCTSAPDCNVGFHCQQQPFQSGVCRRYCNTSDGATGCPQTPVAQSCSQLDGATTGVGSCF